MIGFINGNKIPLNADFVPLIKGKAGEDLNDVKTTQIRNYPTSLNTVKNIPNVGSDQNWNWFSVQTIMQDDKSGLMLLFLDNGRWFIRNIASGKWTSWKEVSFK